MMDEIKYILLLQCYVYCFISCGICRNDVVILHTEISRTIIDKRKAYERKGGDFDKIISSFVC